MVGITLTARPSSMRASMASGELGPGDSGGTRSTSTSHGGLKTTKTRSSASWGTSGGWDARSPPSSRRSLRSRTRNGGHVPSVDAVGRSAETLLQEAKVIGRDSRDVAMDQGSDQHKPG